MRTAKYILLSMCIACISLAQIQCAKKGEKEVAGAAESMAKNKLVRILTNAVNLPFEFGAGTSVQGFDVDIGNEIAKDLGWESKWVKMEHTRLVEILLNGEAELVISAFPIETPLTDAQKAAVQFSEPYFSSYDTIAHRKDKPELKDFASLAGKKVGVQRGSTGEAFLKAQNANVTMQQFATLDDGLGALNRTEIDAMVGDATILTYSIYKSFQNLMTVEEHLDETHFAVVMRKADQDVLEKVNATLQRLKSSGQLEELRKKWFQDVMEQAAQEREKYKQNLALMEAPKSIIIEMVKGASANFDFSRLDGYVAELAGPSGSYKSEPILTNGNRGTIRFPVAVPPGKYELRMTIFRLAKELPIPKKPTKVITFDMRIGSTIELTEREK